MFTAFRRTRSAAATMYQKLLTKRQRFVDSHVRLAVGHSYMQALIRQIRKIVHTLERGGIERSLAVTAVVVTVLSVSLALTTQTRYSFRVFADEKRVVQLYVDGKQRIVVSSAPTVQEILTENGIAVKQGDVVEPELETVVDQPNYNINVYRAAPAVVEDSGRFVQVVTGYRSARKIAAAAGVTLYPEDTAAVEQVQDFQSTRTLGYKVKIDRALPIQLILAGEVVNVRTHTQTVGELLKEKNVEYEASDLQGVTVDTKLTSGSRIVLSKIQQETLVATEDVRPGTQTIYDANMDAGSSQNRRPGVAGRKQVTYLIEKQNGQETKRTVLNEQVLTAAIDAIVVRGSKPVAGSRQLPSPEQWAKLRFCESGGRYSVNTGNGYYGAYQMNIDFWRAYGGNPAILPSQGSPEEQDAVALRGYLKRGSQPWPVCGRYLN